jgi:hypothetical protein
MFFIELYKPLTIWFYFLFPSVDFYHSVGGLLFFINRARMVVGFTTTYVISARKDLYKRGLKAMFKLKSNFFDMAP